MNAPICKIYIITFLKYSCNKTISFYILLDESSARVKIMKVAKFDETQYLIASSGFLPLPKLKKKIALMSSSRDVANKISIRGSNENLDLNCYL